jgi:hypothetical protein
VGPLDRRARLQVLVDLEEVGDLHPVEDRDVVDALYGRVARVVRRDAEDLLVGALLVPHHEHADGAALDHTAGIGELADRDECVWGTPRPECGGGSPSPPSVWSM